MDEVSLLAILDDVVIAAVKVAELKVGHEWLVLVLLQLHGLAVFLPKFDGHVHRLAEHCGIVVQLRGGVFRELDKQWTHRHVLRAFGAFFQSLHRPVESLGVVLHPELCQCHAVIGVQVFGVD